MRKIGSIVALLAIVYSYSGCKKLKEKFTEFDIPVSGVYPVPIDSVLGVMKTYTTIDFQTTLDDELLKRNSSKNLIESGKLTHMEMNIIRYDTSVKTQYGFIEEIKVYIDADGLGKTFVGAKSPVPSNAGLQVVFDIDDVELKEYLKRESFRLIIETILREPIKQITPMQFKSNYHIRAKLLK
ncbi:MAG: hypothetical protein H7321_07275 [Bacteroidia bacterium]|nr:hypothetical protein [Bacteroidia bacterium]